MTGRGSTLDCNDLFGRCWLKNLAYRQVVLGFVVLGFVVLGFVVLGLLCWVCCVRVCCVGFVVLGFVVLFSSISRQIRGKHLQLGNMTSLYIPLNSLPNTLILDAIYSYVPK
jgi:hypothetical protein